MKYCSQMRMPQVWEWMVEDVGQWLQNRGHKDYVDVFFEHRIDGKALLVLTESDLRLPPLNIRVLGDIKRLALDLRRIQVENQHVLAEFGYEPLSFYPSTPSRSLTHSQATSPQTTKLGLAEVANIESLDGVCSFAVNGQATQLKPELWKAFISLAYLFLVTWITAFVMVIVHDRVPDMKKYPPLPDIFLDNVPHIPWAFDMCEVTGTVLLVIWVGVLTFHKHRFILVRRFFALCGTVFLLRCVTMLITSLSVPGTHLQCNPRVFSVGEERLGDRSHASSGAGDKVEPYGDLWAKIYQAYLIWRGAGMAIQGVRTCGDYMFSGHTVALTMLNFFITEYTPRQLYFIHTFTWLMNMFGIFFILAAHEHYSIDVFIAFYITSRLFLYYHTLANNQALMQRDSNRTRIWFPLFSFFESEVDGIVPNEYEWPISITRIKAWVKNKWVKLVLNVQDSNSYSATKNNKSN